MIPLSPDEERVYRDAMRAVRARALRFVFGCVFFALWVWALAGALDQAFGR